MARASCLTLLLLLLERHVAEEQNRTKTPRNRNSNGGREGHVAETFSAGGGHCVVLAGPHKTGSTHVQTFLHTPRVQAYLRAHGNWNLVTPLSPPADRLAGGPRPALWVVKGPADAVRYILGRETRQNQSAAMRDSAVMRERIAKVVNGKGNVIIAQESFAHAMTDAKHASNLLAGLDEWLQPCTRRTVAIIFRTPRVAHLLSKWGQVRPLLTGESNASFAAYAYNGIGSCYQHVERDQPCEHLMLPLRLSSLFYSAAAAYNVAIVDTTNLSALHLDIADVIACEVLGVPCGANGTATWSHGANTAIANADPTIRRAARTSSASVL